MISDQLSGKRIAITGATGFLGTAIVERLLRSVPNCEVVCIVRPTRRFSPMERILREVIRNDCFDVLRKEHGDNFDSMINKRVHAIAGDVSSDELGLDSTGLAMLASCDVVIHSAATVSFESPIDQAIEVNLLGPTRVAQAIRKANSSAHLIAVSTAYVAGNRRGDAYEELITEAWYSPDIDWRAEVTAGRRALADAENESRQIEALNRFRKQARRELGAAGMPIIAERTEKLRQEWVKQRLIDQGKARAQSLSWPDVYAFTKALGERALLEERGEVRVTFVRPSIIESALEEPFPGWIRGFRMAEPILIGIGKGLLDGFPGLPEGVIDVIPVDKVVAAIIAIAAKNPDKNEQPSVYQVASGDRQPLHYRRLVDEVTDYYTQHPLYDADGQPIPIAEWAYPQRGKVAAKLDRAILALDLGERVLQRLPLRGKVAQLAGTIEDKRLLAQRALGYVEIYGAYTECEAKYNIDRTLGLFNQLEEADKSKFNFDPIDIDWHHYLHNIHMPSVIAQGRVRTQPVKKTYIDRNEKARRAILSPQRKLATFNLENTLIASNVVENYARLATRNLSPFDTARLVAKRLPMAPRLAVVDRRDRGDFLREFYRWYAGADVEELRQAGRELFDRMVLAKAFAEGLQRVRDHREAGHRTLLITGALDIVVEPLQVLFDDIICARMSEKDGKFTGELLEPPPVGEARALAMKSYAEKHNIDLSDCVGYGNSPSDLPILEAVGIPVAVNPDTRLAAVAHRRGWHVENWSARGDSKWLVSPSGSGESDD